MAEMLKADKELTSQELERLFDQIWKEERVPKQWTKGLICKSPRKATCRVNRRGPPCCPSEQGAQQDPDNRIQVGVDHALRKNKQGFEEEEEL